MSIKEDEDSFDPITIDSKGNIDSVSAMTPGSLKSALETLAKYAKMLEEEGVDTDAIPQKMLDKHMEDNVTIVEDDVSNKD